MLLYTRRPWCRWRRYSWKVTDSILDLVGETAGSQGHPRIKMQNMEEVEIFILITPPCKTSLGLIENIWSENLKCDDGSGVLLHGHEQGRCGHRGGVHGLLHHQQQLHQQSSGPALESWPHLDELRQKQNIYCHFNNENLIVLICDQCSVIIIGTN